MDNKLQELLNNEKELTAQLDEANKNVMDALENFRPIVISDIEEATIEETTKNDDLLSIDDSNNVIINETYERELYDMLVQEEALKNQIAIRKAEIKAFIENHDLKSFSTELLDIKYTSATTTTTIDSTKLKKEHPEIAAEYSKVSARASSISINPKGTK